MPVANGVQMRCESVMTQARTALVTGATGQDGFHLIELLLSKGYNVVGTSRESSSGIVAGAQGLQERVKWDGMDQETINRILAEYRPDECYNLAAYASGAGMYDDPVAIGEINGLAVSRILESIRTRSPGTRFMQASSSEVFGTPTENPQDESSARHPRSPYGAAKLYADAMVKVYRERYGLFACSAILYNHESPRRGLGFVTRKVTRGAAAIKLGLAEELSLGNLDAQRDWGYAGDYVEAMWLMLQANAADDYVVATGILHTVRELCEHAFARVDLDYRDHVREDHSAFRPIERVPLVGNAGKAALQIGWRPSMDFKSLIEMMVDHDLAQLRDANMATGVH